MGSLYLGLGLAAPAVACALDRTRLGGARAR